MHPVVLGCIVHSGVFGARACARGGRGGRTGARISGVARGGGASSSPAARPAVTARGLHMPTDRAARGMQQADFPVLQLSRSAFAMPDGEGSGGRGAGRDEEARVGEGA